VRERLRDRSGGQFRGLSQHLAHRVAVEVAERAGGQGLLQVEHFEEVELEISHVALVMTHNDRLSSRLRSSRSRSALWRRFSRRRTRAVSAAAAATTL